MELNEKTLFNTQGDDSPSSQSLIGGNPTGILNLDENKYKWVGPLYKTMLGNFWIPEKVSMVDDRNNRYKLTEAEEEATKNTLSFLIFLDSLQVENLGNVADYITNAGVSNLLHIQEFQEVIHAQSYQYILQNLWSSDERRGIYNRWRDNPRLMKRNTYIAGIYQDFVENKTRENFKRVLVANYLLEGIYFYSGFNFFEQLASRNKLTNSNEIISYIKNDEGTHLALFLHMIKEGEVVDVSKDVGMIQDMIGEAVKQEIDWAQYNYGNNILGITHNSSKQYIEYLGNQRLKAIGMQGIFSNSENPYKHLEGATEKNFFETTVTDYSMADSIGGWDDF